MCPSNSRECWESTISKRIVGVLMGALPINDAGIAGRCKSLIFDDGTALTVCNNGSFWTERAEDVKRAIERKHKELAAIDVEMHSTLAAAGALDVEL